MLDRELREAVAGRYVSVGIVIRSIANPERFDTAELAASYSIVDNVGLGVAQSARQGPLSGRIWVVAIFGRYR